MTAKVSERLRDIVEDLRDLNVVGNASVNDDLDALDDAIEEVEDLEREVENLRDDLDAVEEDLAEERDYPSSCWVDWVSDCIARLPRDASLGDNIKLTEILNKAIRSL